MKFDFSYLDIAFKNGSVITVNDTDEIAEAVGIKGNKIVFVGPTRTSTSSLTSTRRSMIWQAAH